MKNKHFYSLFLVGIFCMVMVPSALFASTGGTLATYCDDADDPLGLECVNESGLSDRDPRLIITSIINVTLGLLGIIATTIILYAGFRWMTSGGNSESVDTAKKTLFAAVVGLVIILSAYAISNFVLRNLHRATTGIQYGNDILR
ncbi:hypothetical protein HOF40_03395 [Candidatus Parcubacteria bacterium]|jgi:hypothetical protein|nr:hypothetical protein [Candidatus Parcubacteria bacterium]MBT3949107.1 hypothetical protein [Candidatus Parcubacteria bacterium]